MRRFVTGLLLLALTASCRGESGCRGSWANRSTKEGPVVPEHSQKTAAVTALELAYGEPPRLSHKHALGDIRGHAWSQDEGLLAIWSESTVLVFDMHDVHERFRTVSPRDRRIGGAGFSPDGRWVVVASQALDATSSELDLFATGESTPRRRFSSASRSWQIGDDGHTITWLQLTSLGSNSGLRLRVDLIETEESRLSVDLPDIENADIPALELGKIGKVVLVYRPNQLSLVDPATGHSWNYPSIADPVLATSGEAAAWATHDGFVLWSLARHQLLTLSNARCAPRNWPQRAAARALFSADERTLATSGATGICLWDVATGRLITVLQKPRDRYGSEYPKWPNAWVLSDKGLIVDASELWDVERRRLVRDGFAQFRQQGPQPLLLEVPDESDRPVQLLTVDAQFGVHHVAQERCLLDLHGGESMLVSLDRAVAIACQPNPWIVDLQTGSSRRIERPSGTKLAASPRGSHLTLTTEHGFSLTNPHAPGSEHTLIRDLGSVTLTGFDSRHLWLVDSPEWQEFKWTTLDVSNAKHPILASGTVQRRCGSGVTYLVGAHFAWSHPDSSPLMLCDLTTERLLGTLEDSAGAKVLALNSDATVALVGGPRARLRFWFIVDQRTVDLDDKLYETIFAGPHTVVGKADGKVVAVNALTGARSGGWDLPTGHVDRLLAADVTQDLAVFAGTSATLRRLGDGQVVARLQVPTLRSAVFGPNSRLLASDNQRIWVWHLPSTAPVGELVLDSGAVLYVASNGSFETSSPVVKWAPFLSCAAGPHPLPLEACLDSKFEAGLFARALGTRSVRAPD